MLKAHRKSREEEDNDTPLHRTINEAEARQYSLALDDIIIKMGMEIKNEVHDAMREAILAYKQEIEKLIPGMDKADTDVVWHSIKDKVGLCIYPQTEDSNRKLECLIPDKEVLSDSRILKAIEDLEDLTAEDRILITELFDSLEVAHSELASACSALGRLSKKPKAETSYGGTESEHQAPHPDQTIISPQQIRCSWWHAWASRWSRGEGWKTHDSRPCIKVIKRRMSQQPY